jgi:serine/threonine protein kinase
MASTPSLLSLLAGRLEFRSSIDQPTTEVCIAQARCESATNHSGSGELLETLSKINGGSSRERSILSRSKSSVLPPRTDSSALLETADITPLGHETQNKLPRPRVVTKGGSSQETITSVPCGNDESYVAAPGKRTKIVGRSAPDPKSLDHDGRKASVIIRTLRDVNFNLRTSSLESPPSSTASSDQDRERILQRKRRAARSHLREARRYPWVEDALSPSTESSEPWNHRSGEVEEQFDGQGHINKATFDASGGGGGLSSRPAAHTIQPNPLIILQRQATIPLVTSDPKITDSNDGPYSNTREHLGIPSSSTFARPRYQGQVSILPEVKWDWILPTTITANLHLRFHGITGTTEKLKTVPCFVWSSEDSYHALFAEKTIATPDKHELYLRHACCCVLDTPRFKQDIYYSNVDDDDPKTLSHHAIQNICDFIGIYPFHPFTLEIYWDYSSVQLETVGPSSDGMHTSLADTIQSEIRRKMDATRNFEDQKYIARGDLEPFLEFEVVYRVIREDGSLSLLNLNDEQKLEFARTVQTLRAVVLFAICVYAGLEMRVLWHFVKVHHFSDKKLPNTNVVCDWPACADKARKICETKPGFFPRRIEEDRQFHELKKEEIMPLYHAGPNRTKKRLGKGASGSVYEVGIDPAHTYLSGVGRDLCYSRFTLTTLQDPGFRFALKEFSEERNRDAFNREYKMLKVLANYTDEHIVAPHTFWSQGEKCFILYPRAEASLREFTQRKPPDLGRENVLWFLEQLRGLAEAIDHVHDLNPLPTRTNPRPKEVLLWGSHRDIKPENILVFQTSRPVFKIADFGAGVFNPVAEDGISAGSPDNPGTPAYWAPDLKMKGRVSRPADMWALGCVYLELLLWYFQFFTADKVDHFSTRRAAFTGADPNFKDNLFWYKKRTSNNNPRVYLLRPAVAAALHDLAEICHKMRVFERLIKMISGLLEVDSDKRWKASELARSMKNITKQAKSDLRDQPDFYLRRYYQNTGGSYQDVKLPNETINPLVSMAGSTRTASPSGHQRMDSMESGGPSRISGSPTSPMLLATGTADALDAHSPDTPIEFLDPEEPAAHPSLSNHLEIPHRRPMSENHF